MENYKIAEKKFQLREKFADVIMRHIEMSVDNDDECFLERALGEVQSYRMSYECLVSLFNEASEN